MYNKYIVFDLLKLMKINIEIKIVDIFLSKLKFGSLFKNNK